MTKKDPVRGSSSARTVTVEADAGARQLLDCGYVEQHLEHAYALTSHGSQATRWSGRWWSGGPRSSAASGATRRCRARDSTVVHLVSKRPSTARDEFGSGEQLDRGREETVGAFAARLREPHVEELALEQLEAARDPSSSGRTGWRRRRRPGGSRRRLASSSSGVPRGTSRGSTSCPTRSRRSARRAARGDERAGRLPELADADRAWLAGRGDDQLAALETEHAAAASRLDMAGRLPGRAARAGADWLPSRDASWRRGGSRSCELSGLAAEASTDRGP
jgi:hypothetical protein